MHSKTFITAAIALIAAVAGMAASAQDITPESPIAFTSAVTRAQVKAEAVEAVRIGALWRGEQNSVPTEAQLDSIRMAGQRAAAMQMAMHLSMMKR